MNIAGSFASITMVYVVPVALYNLKGNSSKLKKNINWLVGGFGLLSGLVAIIYSFLYGLVSMF